MGSPLTAMMANSPLAGVATVDDNIRDQCRKMTPQQRQQSGICPPDTVPGEQPEAAIPAGQPTGVPEHLARAGEIVTPEMQAMSGVGSNAVALAGGGPETQQYMTPADDAFLRTALQTEGAANAYQKPGIGELLRALFR